LARIREGKKKKTKGNEGEIVMSSIDKKDVQSD